MSWALRAFFMSWIRSDENLPRHPKTLALKSMMNIEMDALVGRLHFLWWWVLAYALDGDLSKKEPKVIEQACQIPFKFLIRAGFVDSRPYRRIHDWWDNQGNYLKLRFKDHPDKWMRIKELYERKEHQSSLRSIRTSEPKCNPVDVPQRRTDVANGRTDVDLISAREASLGAPPALKSYEEAEDDEVCAPPKDLWEKVKKGMK